MNTLNDFFKTDDLHDVMAAHVNDLIASSLRSEYSNVETLAGTRALLDVDTPIQRFDCDGADRIVKAPTPNTTENHPYTIINSTASGSWTLSIQNNGGTTTHIVLYPNQAALMLPDGNGGYTAIMLRANVRGVSSAIEGLQLIWNSATSLSVGTGICYAENGDQIEVPSPLTASSLSLSASTWYHMYVYLSSGSPAMEVVTTAPVAWKGTAYSKTGDTSRRYVGSVKTDGSGNVYEFSHDPLQNLIVYRNLLNRLPPFRVVTATTTATDTTASLSDIVPATFSLALVRATGTADQAFYLGYGTDATNYSYALLPGNTVQQQVIGLMPATNSLNIYYKHISTPSVGNSNIDIYGYTYKR